MSEDRETSEEDQAEENEEELTLAELGLWGGDASFLDEPAENPRARGACGGMHRGVDWNALGALV